MSQVSIRNPCEARMMVPRQSCPRASPSFVRSISTAVPIERIRRRGRLPRSVVAATVDRREARGAVCLVGVGLRRMVEVASRRVHCRDVSEDPVLTLAEKTPERHSTTAMRADQREMLERLDWLESPAARFFRALGRRRRFAIRREDAECARSGVQFSGVPQRIISAKRKSLSIRNPDGRCAPKPAGVRQSCRMSRELTAAVSQLARCFGVARHG